MQYDKRHQKTIIICLNDSIFKDKNTQLTLQQLKNVHQKYDQHNNQKINKTITVNYQLENQSIQYLNGSYFGKTTLNKQPLGSGIFIDDQFNFFMSNWKNNNKMNGLTLVMLLNGVKLYGTWIDGNPNGWNCIEITKHIKIFIELKISKGEKYKIQSPILMIDESKKISYLIQVQHSESMYTKISIINRKQMNQFLRKEKDITFIDPKDIFEQMIDAKIPQFLLSFKNFLLHINQNVQDIEIKKIEKDSQRLTFLSIKDTERITRKSKSKFFIPYPQLLQANQNLSEKNKKKLGIILSLKSNRKKAIGEFSNEYQLTGKGLSFTSSTSFPLFGIFKSDMLIKQFQHPQPFDKKYLHSRQLKKQLTQHHMKSINFINNFVYFHQVDSLMKLVNQIVEFVNIFQQQYSIKHGKEVDSFAQSQNQYEQIKYQNQNKNQLISQKKAKEENFQKFQQQTNIFVKRKDQFTVQQKKMRPFGKIVNSCSPLRQIPSHSHSKSPSEIQTYRQRKPYPSPNISLKKSHQKDLMISLNQSFNHFSNKYNIETIRNKKKIISQNLNNENNKKARYFLAHNNRQTQKQEEIMQTIRIKNESNIQSLYQRNSVDQTTNNFYSRHLRNNYIDHR